LPEPGLRNESLLSTLFAWRRLVYALALAGAVVSVVVSLALPNWYAARATLLPPSGSDAERGFLQMSSAIGIDLSGMGLKSEAPSLDLMIGVLKSRRLREQVVDSFGLVEVYGSETRQHAIKELSDYIVISSTAEGLIEVEVEDRDGERAAALANALVAYLDEYNRETSVEEARRTSAFIRSYLEENQQRLTEAADSLQRFQRAHGAIELTEQTRATVEAAAELQAEKTRLEIERDVLSGYTSREHYKMVELQAQIDEIDVRLDEIIWGAGGGSGSSGVLLPLSDLPELGYDLARLTRDVMVLEKVESLLITEFEQSRIQEAKDLQSIQVVDRAVPPIKKSRPRRSMIVLLTVVLMGLAGTGLAFACDGILSNEGGWTTDGLASSREVRLLLRVAHRLARFSGVE